VLIIYQTNNLISCTTCFTSSAYGGAYTKFISLSSSEIIASLDALIQSFIVSKEHQSHLPAIGALHECIDSVKANLDVIPDNVAAVRKRWSENVAFLNDALAEIGDLIDGNTASEGWDELGLEPLEDSEELSTNEKQICEKVLFLSISLPISYARLGTSLCQINKLDAQTNPLNFPQ
jgi:hypothetical protein